jgi:endonuclease/exonuclease/phosphatase (EEP) superfamily protein YafD
MPNRSRRSVPLIVTLVLGAPVALLLAWPQVFGAALAPGVAQLVAFRAVLAIGLGLFALAAAVIAVLRRRGAVAAGVALVLAAASVANGAILVARGYGADETAPTGGDLTVVAWNTEGGGASPESVAQLVRAADADIVSLPETNESAAAEVADLLAADGRAMSSFTTYGERGDSRVPTSVLIADELGEYRLDESAGSTPRLPSAVWVPVDGSGPTVVAAHPIPPVPGAMGAWRAGLAWVADRCAAPDVIVAGDLNATVDHLSAVGGSSLIGACRDAAAEVGGAATGTWPTTIPSWLASPIDHVLVGSAWRVRSVAVPTSFDEAGSDHRPIIAVLEAR